MYLVPFLLLPLCLLQFLQSSRQSPSRHTNFLFLLNVKFLYLYFDTIARISSNLKCSFLSTCAEPVHLSSYVRSPAEVFQDASKVPSYQSRCSLLLLSSSVDNKKRRGILTCSRPASHFMFVPDQSTTAHLVSLYKVCSILTMHRNMLHKVYRTPSRRQLSRRRICIILRLEQEQTSCVSKAFVFFVL